MVGGLNFTFAPPSKLVTSFFVMGAVFYLFASVSLFGINLLDTNHLNPKAVGFVHLFLVGFVMSIIFGAMYQLISVVLEIPLFSDTLAYTHLSLFAIGVIPFVSSLLSEQLFLYLGYGSLILYISFVIYIINILLSLKKVKKRDIKYMLVGFGHVALFVGISYALLSSLALVHGEIGLDSVRLVHSHIPLVLFIFMGGIIAIIATVLLPMFMLSHNFNKDISRYIFRLLLISSLFSIFGWIGLIKAASILFLALFAYQLYDIFKKRLRKQIDVYAMDMVTSIISMIFMVALLPFISDERVLKIFTAILFIGFFSSFVVGHIYKIVPFLVWNDKFAPLVGKQKVPMLADMVHKRGSELEFYTKIATLFIFVLALITESNALVKTAEFLFVLNALMVLTNLIYIFRYKG